MKKINHLYNLLDKVIKKKIPDCILLSGGIDSSSIAFIARKHNPKLNCITVATINTTSPDVKFAKIVSKKIKIKKHIIALLNEKEIEPLINKVVLSLKCFNYFWVSAALVLYKGLEAAKKNNFNMVATGEGSDDLFGSFPVMLKWGGTERELIKLIRRRMDDIDLMTEKMAECVGIKIILPFHNVTIKNYALKLPMNLRIMECPPGNKITKFILREAFNKLLPKIVVNRPQSMAFIGASTLDYLLEKYKNYASVSEYTKKFNIKFNNAFECYLFDILNNHHDYKPANKGIRCLYCSSALRAIDSVHCTVCGTLQYKNKILPF
jgi:asparagine synthetase B (glutamine-hydrolysing)